MSEESKLVRMVEKLGEKRLLSGVRAGVGAVFGIIDCTLLQGMPIFTLGAPAADIAGISMNYNPIFKRYSAYADENCSLLKYCRNLGSYFLSASIPFIVKYHKEIADLTNKLF